MLAPAWTEVWVDNPTDPTSVVWKLGSTYLKIDFSTVRMPVPGIETIIRGLNFSIGTGYENGVLLECKTLAKTPITFPIGLFNYQVTWATNYPDLIVSVGDSYKNDYAAARNYGQPIITGSGLPMLVCADADRLIVKNGQNNLFMTYEHTTGYGRYTVAIPPIVFFFHRDMSCGFVTTTDQQLVPDKTHLYYPPTPVLSTHTNQIVRVPLKFYASDVHSGENISNKFGLWFTNSNLSPNMVFMRDGVSFCVTPGLAANAAQMLWLQ